MTNSADPDQLASSDTKWSGSQLIWIYTVRKDRVYLGSAGQGLIMRRLCNKQVTLQKDTVLQVTLQKDNQ